MELAIHNFIGSVCLWVNAPLGERKRVAAELVHHFQNQLLCVHRSGWLVIVDASHEAFKATYEGFAPIDAANLAFKRLRYGMGLE